MPGIISGYEYDIFISYRQKDNKHDRWVSEFVDNLRGELESTFKEEVSVYFDINPHDGLLETHDISASLKEKLRCAVFIPIVSRTYCDPESFAWDKEFKAFIEFASADPNGIKVRLPNGNIASRVLPVRIHDLDTEDRLLLEKELGGNLRSVDFVYAEPGVNRPLRPVDDKNTNLYRTDYRNQVNKVSNAAKDIISALRGSSVQAMEEEAPHRASQKERMDSKKLVSLIALFLLLSAAGVLFYSGHKSAASNRTSPEISIAIIPFQDLSPGKNQEYFCSGIMQEILNHLFKLGGLNIPSSATLMSYIGTGKSPRQMGKELKVDYILVGSVLRDGNKVRINVDLINTVSDKTIWIEKYDEDITDVLSVQSAVAQKIATSLKINITPDVKSSMQSRITGNTEALDLYLQAKGLGWSDQEESEKLLRRVIQIDPECGQAYSLLGGLWLSKGIFNGYMPRQTVLDSVAPLFNKALEINYRDPYAHAGMGYLELFYLWDFKKAESEFDIAHELNPSDLEQSHVVPLLISGNFDEALKRTEKAYSLDPASHCGEMGLCYYFMNDHAKALSFCNEALKEDSGEVFTNGRLCIYLKKFDNGIYICENRLKDKKSSRPPYLLGYLGILYFQTGMADKAVELVEELKAQSSWTAIGSPAYYTAMTYAQMMKPDLSFKWLDVALKNHEMEMVWLKQEPNFRPLHNDPRWQEILSRVGFPS